MPRTTLSTPDGNGFRTVGSNSRKRNISQCTGDTGFKLSYLISDKQQARLTAKALKVNKEDGLPTLYWCRQTREMKDLCGMIAANHSIGEEIFSERRLNKIGDILLHVVLESEDLSALESCKDDEGNIVPFYDERGNYHIFVLLMAFEIYFGRDVLERVRLQHDSLMEAYIEHSNLIVHFPPECSGHYVTYIFNDGRPWDLDGVNRIMPKMIVPSEGSIGIEEAARATIEYINNRVTKPDAVYVFTMPMGEDAGPKDKERMTLARSVRDESEVDFDKRMGMLSQRMIYDMITTSAAQEPCMFALGLKSSVIDLSFRDLQLYASLPPPLLLSRSPIPRSSQIVGSIAKRPALF